MERTDSAKTIILAGGTGDLGHRIATYLLQAGAQVKILVRKESDRKKTADLEKMGARMVVVDFSDTTSLAAAVSGGHCVVSALSGLREVIVTVQTNLLQAAVTSGVPRFIPSDFCIDYTKLAPGTNRNLDLRREFHERLNKAPLSATSILNGMFTDLLTGQAPVVLFGLKRVLYWGDKDQLLDFTTIDNTAAYTASAVLDNSTPRFLRIAGEVASAKDLQKAATGATGKQFGLLRAGGLGLLKTMTAITKKLAPGKGEVFPPWQGMQYMHNMYTGLPKLQPLDNDRYPAMRWTSVKEVLAGSLPA